MIRPHLIKTYLIWMNTYPFWKGGGATVPLNFFADPGQLLDPLAIINSIVPREGGAHSAGAWSFQVLRNQFPHSVAGNSNDSPASW